MPVKISSLELENVKRVRAVRLEPSASGLTVIGGRNGQGKTSVLDAIAYALGGEKFRPSAAQREGSVLPPSLRIELSNGLIVERSGKNSALRVTDPNGIKYGQKLLDTFIEALALNLPKFMQASDAEKAKTLLGIIGVGDELAQMERQEQALYNERRAVGQEADRKRKFADEMPRYEGMPDDIISAAELIQRQQAILQRNAENANKRANVATLTQQFEMQEREVDRLQREVNAALDRLKAIRDDLDIAERDAAELHDESTEALEHDIAQVDEINAKVRANLDKAKAAAEATEYAERYAALSQQIEDVRARRRGLLENAPLPLPGLTVEDGALKYNGQAWDCMSGAEQLKVATAIVRRLNPECGFVLMDKLEQMDAQTLAEFGAWLESEGLQVIATRVSTGEECTIIIEDGMVQGATGVEAATLTKATPAKAKAETPTTATPQTTASKGKFEMGVF